MIVRKLGLEPRVAQKMRSDTNFTIFTKFLIQKEFILLISFMYLVVHIIVSVVGFEPTTLLSTIKYSSLPLPLSYTDILAGR